MFNFTIIIPHKNIPNLLQRCLDSIPVRDDLQIIIVDDNSDPNIVNFKNFPGCKKANTEVLFTKEGRGAGYARNIGLKHAKGKWILFADADDYFLNNFISFLEKFKDNNSDLIFFNAQSESRTPNRTAHLNHFINLAESDQAKSELYLRYSFGEPWCKMVKKNVIEKNHIFFEETVIHNDTQFSYLVGFYSQSFSIEKDIIYCVSNQPNSISKKSSKDVFFIRTMVFSKKQDFLQKKGINFSDSLLIAPFWDSFVQKRPLVFLHCLLIARQYNVSLFSIMKKVIERRNKIKKGIEISPFPE